MKVLQLARCSVSRPSNGRQRRVWETTKRFTDFGDVWLATPTDPSDVDHDNINVVRLSPKLFDTKFVKIHLWTAGLALGWSNPVNQVLSHHVESVVPTSEVEFDLVTCEAPQMLLPALSISEEFDLPLLLNKHNASYKNNKSLLEEVPVPSVIADRTVESLRQLEQRAINEADAVVFQSEADMEHFDIDGTETRVIQNGTNVEPFTSVSSTDSIPVSADLRDAPLCIFVGSYDYYPNEEAARRIIDDIAPALPDIDFLLVGRNAPDSSAKNVYTPGYVEDLDSVLTEADVALCPLFRGSGTKLKVMDYMAAELPIVTTEVGAAGIRLKDGENALFAQSTEEFIDAIETLIESPELRESLSNKAGELAVEYTWESLFEEYDEVVRETVGDLPEGGLN